MNHYVMLALRALITLLGLGALAAQAVIVYVVTVEVPEVDRSPLGLLYAAAAITAIAAVQVGLVALWVLLTMVRRDVIFDERAFGWVKVIAVAGLVAAILLAGLCMVTGELDDAPGLILIGAGIGLAGVAFALVMAVMHELLRNATMLRHELDEVV